MLHISTSNQNGTMESRFNLLVETTEKKKNWTKEMKQWFSAMGIQQYGHFKPVSLCYCKRLPASPRATCSFIHEKEKGNICSVIPSKSHRQISLIDWTNWGDGTTTMGVKWMCAGGWNGLIGAALQLGVQQDLPTVPVLCGEGMSSE